ncbi:hypothetical protein DENSPDRAFT_868872 [Dentipellis sp. KUC8613]|nr:hypothetical protein DENSPDRAFT_868872 [Dentipellis sp. KUC8613]
MMMSPYPYANVAFNSSSRLPNLNVSNGNSGNGTSPGGRPSAQAGKRRNSDTSDRSGRDRAGQAQTGSSTKIWSIYLSHAEKYDKALVESWKGDMDGILIFSGLFSAVVSAFVVDSYKSLQPDPSETTALVLGTISQQLAALHNGASPIPAADVAHDANTQGPSATQVGINVLWFLSLVFSLSCALGATLVQQWARTYIQGTEERFVPHERARMRTFLLDGVERFGVSAMVQGIPVLLHIALFLFLGGLIVFLFSINTTVAGTVLSICVLCALVYGLLTLLPAIFDACPYRTPLSSVVWNLYARAREAVAHGGRARRAEAKARRRKSLTVVTDPWSHDDTALLGDREHDLKALRWTMDSIMTNNDLEVFMEAIPGFIQSEPAPDGNYLIQALLFGADLLGKRVANLLRTCCSGSMLEVQREKAEKRAAACLNVINLICQTHGISQLASPSVWTVYIIQYFHPVVRDVLILKSYKDSVVSELAGHTSIILTWRAICNYREFLKRVEELLVHYLELQQRLLNGGQGGNMIYKTQISLRDVTSGIYLQNPLSDLLNDTIKDSASKHVQKLASLLLMLASSEVGNLLGQLSNKPFSPAITSDTDILLQEVRVQLSLIKEVLAIFFIHHTSIMLQELSQTKENVSMIYDTLTVISEPQFWEEAIPLSIQNDLFSFLKSSIISEDETSPSTTPWNMWNVFPTPVGNLVSTKVINIVVPFFEDMIKAPNLCSKIQEWKEHGFSKEHRKASQDDARHQRVDPGDMTLNESHMLA